MMNMLNEEELKKVVGGVEDKNRINLAADAAVAEIKIEINSLNDIRGQSGGLITHRHEMLTIYGYMLSKFTELQAFTPTMDDVYRIFTVEYVASLTGRPKEIYDKFKSSI